MDGNAVGGVLMILLVVGVMAAVIAFNAHLARKRREGLQAVADRLGLDYSPGRDQGLADRFGFLDKLAKGTNRYAFNVLSGMYGGHAVRVFDYHYETHSRDSKGRRRTHHHYFSVFLLRIEKSFPELIITQESFFSKVAQACGYDDIDFESAEFSKKFCVRSPDKKFAYDVCHGRMMEFLLQHPYLNLEMERQTLSILCSRRLGPAEIEPRLAALVSVRSLLPDYLFS